MNAEVKQADDLPFQHYTWKHRVVAWVSQHLFDGVVYTAQQGLLTGMKRKGGLGWVPRWLSTPAETAEERFWRSLDVSGKTVYDVGAFHGMVSLFLSRKASQVISYEPNGVNRARFTENLKLNQVQNVRIRPFGLGAKAQVARMVYSPLMTGGATLDGKIGAHVMEASDVRSEDIQITTVDDDIEQEQLPAPDFIKVDVEGWELEVLKGAQRTLQSARPDLFLEMHGDTMNEKRRKVAELVAFLTEAGYTNILHVESGSTVTPANSSVAAQGHLYCSMRSRASR